MVLLGQADQCHVYLFFLATNIHNRKLYTINGSLGLFYGGKCG